MDEIAAPLTAQKRAFFSFIPAGSEPGGQVCMDISTAAGNEPKSVRPCPAVCRIGPSVWHLTAV